MKRMLACILLAALFPAVYLAVQLGQTHTVKQVYLDREERVYFAAATSNRLELIRTDADGAALGRWSMPRYSGTGMYEVEDVVFDEAGDAFCALSLIDALDFSLTEQVWLRIRFADGAQTVLARHTAVSPASPASVRLLARNGTLTSVTTLPHELLVTTIPLDGQSDPTTQRLAAPKNLNAAFPLPDGGIAASTIWCDLYRVDPTGQAERLYGGPGQGGSFCALQVDEAGDIYLNRMEAGWWRYASGSLTQTQLNSGGGAWTGDILDGTRCVYQNESGQAVLCRGDSQVTISLRVPLNATTTALMLLLGLVCAAAVYLALGYILRHDRTVSLLFKQACLILVLLAAGGILLSQSISAVFEVSHEQSLVYMLRKTTHKFSNLLDPAALEAIDLSRAADSAAFRQAKSEFDFRVDQTRLLALPPDGAAKYSLLTENHYVCLLLVRDGELRVGALDDEYVNIPLSYYSDTQLAEEYASLLRASDYDGILIGFDDPQSEWLALAVPLHDAYGQPVGIVEAGISKRQYQMELRQASRDVLLDVALLLGVILMPLFVGLYASLHPLKRLRRAVEATGDGAYGTTVKVKGHDEIAGISAAFNHMSEQIGAHTAHLQTLNEAYSRFLPSKVLEALGKESILAVERGDYVHLDTCILYITASNFERVTAPMEAQQVFHFYNTLCGGVLDQVLDCGGVMQSATQSDIICLFDKRQNCVQAALSISAFLYTLDSPLCEPLRAALSIVEGRVLLGVVGHEKRLSTMTLSASLKLSRRLCAVADQFGARILCPPEVLDAGPWQRRYLGKLEEEGYSLALYDCYEGDAPERRIAKQLLLERFDAAVRLFESGDWSQSRHLFLRCLRESALDPAVRHYLYLCEYNATHPERPKLL